MQSSAGRKSRLGFHFAAENKWVYNRKRQSARTFTTKLMCKGKPGNTGMGSKGRFLETVLSNALWEKVRRRQVRQPQKLLGGEGAADGAPLYWRRHKCPECPVSAQKWKEKRKQENPVWAGLSWAFSMSTTSLFSELPYDRSTHPAFLRWTQTVLLMKWNLLQLQRPGTCYFASQRNPFCLRVTHTFLLLCSVYFCVNYFPINTSLVGTPVHLKLQPPHPLWD